MPNGEVKVLYLSLSGAKVGGAEIQYQYLIEGLNRKRYRPRVICPEGGDLADGLRLSGIPTDIMKLPLWRKTKSIFTRRIAASRLLRSAQEMGIRLIHSEFRMNHYLHWISRNLGVPAVCHVRSPVRPDQIRKYRFNDISMIIAVSN
ncbi:MAG: glycosyltransferase, partial [Candidatus Poribacteria bacterium]|nr:glycosyltransferase [Candidatus Poribacteria bacterium]